MENKTKVNHEDLNNNLNPFLYHFKTGFDVVCAQNGHLVLTILEECKQINNARTKLNSKKGQFYEDEVLEIWKECLKHLSNKLFTDCEEGDTGGIDHMWAMDIILLYLLCS
eukprot:jgi/Psemu1/44158/gm1.44158_g